MLNKSKYQAWGENSDIYKPMMITNKKNICIGNHVFFREGLRMEAITKHNNQHFNPLILIDDFVHAEQHCQIICTDKVWIQKNVTISSFVFISDTEHNYENSQEHILQQPLISRQTIIGEGAFLGIGVKVLGHSIGKHAVIGANSVVTKDIPDFSVAVGSPAKVIKSYDFNNKLWGNVEAGI